MNICRKSRKLTICAGLPLAVFVYITFGYLLIYIKQHGKLLVEPEYILGSRFSGYKSNDTYTFGGVKYKNHKDYQCNHNAEILSFEEEAEKQFEYIHNKQPNISKTFSYPWKHNKEQVNRAMKELQHKAAITQFDVAIGTRCISNGLSFQRILVREIYRNGVSTGGSAFMVRSHSAYLTVCPVVDHFNGSYTVNCPVYGNCTNIVILLKHMDFSCFTGMTQMIERTVWSQNNICSDEFNLNNSTVDASQILSHDHKLKQHLATLPRLKPQVIGEHGHWFKYEGAWKWMGTEGQILPLENNQTLCTCLKRFHKTFFLGASHMDINHNCSRGMCLKHNVSTKFYLTRKVEVVIPTLKKVLAEIKQDSNTSHKYAILIQIGSWDIGQHVLKEAIHEVIPAFHAALKNLYVTQNLSNVKVLVMPAPALPDKDPEGRNLVTRNNWIGATFASCLRKRMLDLKVLFLDEFTFNFPLFWYVGSFPQKLNNHHYAEWKGNRCRGHVGVAFIQLMLSKLCPGHDIY